LSSLFLQQIYDEYIDKIYYIRQFKKFSMKCNNIYPTLLLKLFTISCLSFSILFLFSITLGYASTITTGSDVIESESYWSTGKSMSEDRNELTAVEFDGKIFAMGGEDIASGGDQKDTVEVYDIARDEWIENEIPPMPLPLDHTASAVYDGKIYVVGGFLKHKVPTDKLFIYDPQINEWQEGTSLPSPRAAMGAEFVNGILYVIGGVNASNIPVNTNLAYDPNTDTWSTKSPMPTERHHLVAEVVDGKIFALGGRILGDGIMSEDVEITLTNFDRNEMYDPQTDSWTILEPMLSKRSGFAAAVPADGNIYVFGGQGLPDPQTGGGTISEDVEKYDPILNKWTYENSIPTARLGLTAVSFNDRIFVLGGQYFDDSGLHPLNINEIFHIGKH
jgi:N-acetylneuraminic acid mutarotase